MNAHVTPLQGRNVTIFGFGRREGVALAHFLVTAGAHVLITDRQPAEKLQASLDAIAGLPVALNLGGHDQERILSWSQLICVSPVVPRTLPILLEAVRRGIALSSEVELFFERCPAPILGITGSAGKTTTTTLVGEMLAVADRQVFVGGNIGKPLTPELPAIDPRAAVVMELSSFQLQPMRQSPHVAVVTNITPNHLDRHGSMDEYVDAKAQIVAHQQPGDVAVLNWHDVRSRALRLAPGVQPWWFSRDRLPDALPNAAFSDAGVLWLRRNGQELPLLRADELQIPGVHNQENALAAALAVSAADVSIEAIRLVLQAFRGVEHRLQLVHEVAGVRFYDDSIATAPERVLAALRALSGGLVLILGGRDKHLPWDEIAEEICQRVRVVVLTGEDAALIHDAVSGAATRLGHGPELQLVADFDDAVLTAANVARAGERVVLSPGCTSFDHFVDFAARGDRFAAVVRGWQPATLVGGGIR